MLIIISFIAKAVDSLSVLREACIQYSEFPHFNSFLESELSPLLATNPILLMMLKAKHCTLIADHECQMAPINREQAEKYLML